MLTLFRNLVRSKAALVVIGLLIVSLSVFGITDIFGIGSGSGLVSAGSRSVEVTELDREIDFQLDQMNQQGGSLTRQDIADSGQIPALLNMMGGRIAMAEHLDRLGLSVGKDAVIDQLRESPVFKSQVHGGFDNDLFQQYLANRRQSENAYRQRLEDDLTAFAVGRAFGSALRVPDGIAQLNAVYRGETRGVAYMVLSPDQVTDLPEEPTEEEIREYYNSQQQFLIQPERRSFSVIAVRPADFIHKANVTDEEILNDYEAQITRFSGPESRSYEALSFTSEEVARRALGRILGGEDVSGVRTGLNGQQLPQQTGTRTELQPSELATSVFQSVPDLWSGPVQMLNGQWVLFRVTEVIPGEPVPLEEVRDLLISEIAEYKSRQLYEDSFEEIDDFVGSDVTLEDVAELIGSPVYTYPPVDRNGRTEDGLLIRSLSSIEGAIDYGFDLYPDETGFRQDAGDVQYIMRLDGEVASYLPEFEDVRDDLKAQMMASGEQASVGTLAEEISDRIRDGGFISVEAEQLGLEVMRTPQPVSRTSGRQAGFSEDALARIFAAKLDEPVIAPVRGGLMIGVVESVNVPPGDQLATMVPLARTQISTILEREFEQGLFDEAMESVELNENAAAINAYIESNQSPE